MQNLKFKMQNSKCYDYCLKGILKAIINSKNICDLFVLSINKQHIFDLLHFEF